MNALFEALEAVLEEGHLIALVGVGRMPNAGAIQLAQQFLARELAEAADGLAEIEAQDVGDSVAADAPQRVARTNGESEFFERGFDRQSRIGGSWFHDSPSGAAQLPSRLRHESRD